MNISVIGIGGVGGYFGGKLTRLLKEREDLSLQVKGVMEEVFQISLKQKIGLPDTIVSDSFDKGRKFPLGYSSSI